MEKKKYTPAQGNCIISEDVIGIIAGNAALETPGVATLAHRPADWRGIVTSASGKSVVVMNTENDTSLDVYITLQAQARIQETSAEVQRNVKSAVQAMTGKPVTRVNIHVMGIVFEEDDKK